MNEHQGFLATLTPEEIGACRRLCDEHWRETADDQSALELVARTRAERAEALRVMAQNEGKLHARIAELETQLFQRHRQLARMRAEVLVAVDWLQEQPSHQASTVRARLFAEANAAASPQSGS